MLKSIHVRISKKGREVLNDKKLTSELVKTIAENGMAINNGETVRVGNSRITVKSAVPTIPMSFLIAFFFLCSICSCRLISSPKPPEIRIIQNDTQAPAKAALPVVYMTVEDYYLANKVWKIVYNEHTRKYAIRQEIESNDQYQYYLGWIDIGGDPLDHPKTIGVAAFESAATVITSSDTAYLKKCLHAYLKLCPSRAEVQEDDRQVKSLNEDFK